MPPYIAAIFHRNVFAAAAQDCARFPVQTITPHIAEQDGQRWLCIPDDAGYPVTREPLGDVLRG